MYERITGEDPYQAPMRIYPAVHYTMGGLWVDYNLMSTIPGLHVLGEANFSDHGANRLGASALMQGLADGYFVIPLHDRRLPRAARSSPTVDDRPRRVHARPSDDVQARIDAAARRSTASAPSTRFHRELGQDHVGQVRHGAQRARACSEALATIPALREEFWQQRARCPAAATS